MVWKKYEKEKPTCPNYSNVGHNRFYFLRLDFALLGVQMCEWPGGGMARVIAFGAKLMPH